MAAANSKWKVFASTEGEFSVEMPGTPTPSKNKTNTPDKLKLKKYDPVVRKHVEYKETKLK